jgi:hypothetical protein
MEAAVSMDFNPTVALFLWCIYIIFVTYLYIIYMFTRKLAHTVFCLSFMLGEAKYFHFSGLPAYRNPSDNFVAAADPSRTRLTGSKTAVVVVLQQGLALHSADAAADGCGYRIT